MHVILSNHAVEQLEKRCRLNKTEAYRVTQRAWDSGRKIKDLETDYWKSLKEKQELNEIKTSIRFYKDIAFVFTRDALLLTAYPKKVYCYR